MNGSTNNKELINAIIVFVTVGILLYITFGILGCQVTVPGKVSHDVSGTVTTVNTIRIEVAIPTEITQAFNNTCQTKCAGNTDQSCVPTCNATQMTNYTNTLLGLLSQLQSTLVPSATK